MQSATLTIPNYYIPGPPPIKVCNNLDNINWNFLWGSSEEHRRLHLVGVETVGHLQGGLGLQVARPNLTLVAKLNSRFMQEKDALWSKVITQNYTSQAFNSSHPNCLRTDAGMEDWLVTTLQILYSRLIYGSHMWSTIEVKFLYF